MNSAKFRKELVKIMPGYNWTVHRQVEKSNHYLSATGIKTSGFNRLSTLEITRREKGDGIEYSARSAGFGKRAPWLSTYKAPTLAQALRGLQNFYNAMAGEYANHAHALQSARAKKIQAHPGG